MSIIKPELTDLKRGSLSIGQIITWKNLKSGDVGDWAEAIGVKRTVSMYGECAGSQCAIEGSNNKDQIGLLHTDFNMDLKFSDTDSFKNIDNLSRMVRPNIINGDDKTNLTVIIMVVN